MYDTIELYVSDLTHSLTITDTNTMRYAGDQNVVKNLFQLFYQSYEIHLTQNVISFLHSPEYMHEDVYLNIKVRKFELVC